MSDTFDGDDTPGADRHLAYTLCAPGAVLGREELGALRHLAHALGVYDHDARDDRRLCAALSRHFAQRPTLFGVLDGRVRSALVAALPYDQAARLAWTNGNEHDKRKFADRVDAGQDDPNAMSVEMADVWLANKRRR